MDAATYLEHVKAAGMRIAEVAEGHLDAQVPSMPGTDLAGLLVHTGGFSVWVGECAATRQMADTDAIDWSGFSSDPIAFHREGFDRLVGALTDADPEAEGWSWGSDQHVRFWFRRAAQELAVHRWDAENAVGDPSPIDPVLAADGVDELLLEFGRSRPEFDRPGAAGMFGGDGETIHLHATDVPTGGEWMITARPDRFEVAHEHGKGDVAARGTASDLLLFGWGRVPPDRLEVFGDASLLERWQDRVKI